VTRVAVIGCGKIAEKHLNAYKKLPGADVTVTDIVDKGRVVADSYGFDWDSDPDKLLASREIEAVDVCTPTPTHADFILRALASGKHVFCEKPLARTLDEALAIKAAAERSDGALMVGYLYRYHPALRFVHEVVDEGIIGTPYFAALRLGGRGSHKVWKHRAETGGGAVNEVAVHMADLALWLFGPVQRATRLHSEIVLGTREIEGESATADAEDLVLYLLEARTGTRVLCQGDLITPGYMNHVEVQGTNGSIFTSILDYLPTTVYCKEARGVYDRGQNVFRFPKSDLFEAELAHFLEVLRGGDQRAVHSVDDSIEVMRMLDPVAGAAHAAA
jgi:myo-inositol 2-dehydrogenase/D-chiro-inositol 1-dehydrogenase